MNTVDRSKVERLAHELRRQEMSRLMNVALGTLGESLRRHHESWLRRRKSAGRVNAAIGTPA